VVQKPSLILADAKTFRIPRIPSATDPGVTVWRDRNGVGALSHVVDFERWLHVLGVASFKLDLAENIVVAAPWEGASEEIIVEEFQNTVWPTMLQLQGLGVLHGSAVDSPCGVVAFCARSEGGKSTLAHALSRRGYAHWADEAVVLDVLPDSVRVQPLAFSVRLRYASAVYFGYSEQELMLGRVRYDVQPKEPAAPLRAICLLEPTRTLPGGKIVSIESLAPATALAGTLEHALYFNLQDRLRKRRMMQQYLNLIAQVAVFRVRFRLGLEWLPSIVDRLEKRIFAATSL